MNTPAYRRDIPFDFAIGDDGDLKMKEDVDAINQSIYIILSSGYGDKPLEGAFGSNVVEELFESDIPIGVISSSIEERIRRAIRKFEPSVIIDQISLNINNLDKNIIGVQVAYTVTDGITSGLFDEQLSILNRPSF